jgi:hypothetical protein
VLALRGPISLTECTPGMRLPHRVGVTEIRAPHASFIQSFERDTRPRCVPAKEAPALEASEEAA